MTLIVPFGKFIQFICLLIVATCCKILKKTLKGLMTFYRIYLKTYLLKKIAGKL